MVVTNIRRVTLCVTRFFLLFYTQWGHFPKLCFLSLFSHNFSYFHRRSPAEKEKANVLIRGLRTTVDFEYEFGLTNMYRRLMPGLESVFLTPAEEHAFISSTIVREVAIHGGNVDQFVPEIVAKALHTKKKV